MFSSKDESRLTDIVETYNKDPSKELEARFYIDDINTLERLYKTLLKQASGVKIEQVLNTISDAGKNITDRKEIWFKDGKKTDEISTRKHKEHYLVVRGLANVQIAVASEKTIPKFGMSKVKEIRLKYRSSLVLDNGWRADFTVVHEVPQNDFQNILTIKDTFFGQKTTPQTFASLFPNRNVELELERLDDSASIKDVQIALETVFEIIDPDYRAASEYQTVIGEIAQLVVPDARQISDYKSGQKTLKQLANQPQTFDFNDYRAILPNIHQYYLSDKADGERCFAYFKDDEMIIITTTRVMRYPLKNTAHLAILDCEILESKSQPRLYAFDVLYYQKPCTRFNTEARFEIMTKAVNELSKSYPQLEEKIQTLIKKPADFEKMYKRKAIYPIDGLILTPVIAEKRSRFSSPHPYFDMKVFKWKPPEKQTIDFLVMECPKKLLGIKPYLSKPKNTLYFLFNGVSPLDFKRLGLSHPQGYRDMFHGYNFRSGYFPAAFQPSVDSYAYLCWIPNSTITSANLHGHIAEFGWDFSPAATRWQFHHLRPDRDTQVTKGLGFGNSFKVAEIIYNGYQDPFTLDHLVNPTKHTATVYFSQTKEEIYKPLTKFNAFVKAFTQRQFEGAGCVMDLAGGKGQDLFTLHGYGVKELHIIDIDKEAIAQIDKRKYNLGNKKLYVFDFKPNKDFKLTTQVADLTVSAKDLIKSVPFEPGTVDGMIMNFAIHYILTNMSDLQNLIEFVKTMLRSQGVFIFTCFDGERVFNLLKSTKMGESVDLMIDDPRAPGETRAKYSIKKLYADKKFKTNGLKISAIHPFSQGEYYEENLVSLKWIMAAFRKSRFTVLQYGSFGDLLGRFEKFNPTWYEKMSDHDKLYASLYSYVSIVKA